MAVHSYVPTSQRPHPTHFHQVFGTAPLTANYRKDWLVNAEAQTTPTPEEYCKQAQTKDEPYCVHCSSPMLQSGSKTAKAGMQANAELWRHLILVPETRSVGMQDDARHDVGSAPIGPGGTEVPVTMLLSD